jgi:membrane protein YdbS with pleckstrin-like domain
MSDHQFFYMKMGMPKGPFTQRQFIELAKQGKIKATTDCIRNDEPSRPAQQFFGTMWPQIEAYRQKLADQEAARKADEHERRVAEKEARKAEKREAAEHRRTEKAEQAAQAAAERQDQIANDPLVWKGNPAWLYYLNCYVVGGIVLVLGLIFAGAAAMSNLPSSVFVAGTVGFVTGGICIGFDILDQKNRVYRVFKDRVEMTSGIVSRSTSEVRVNNIRTVAMEQGIIERIFGLGTVKIGSAGTDGYEVVFFGVTSPSRVKDIVRQVQQNS